MPEPSRSLHLRPPFPARAGERLVSAPARREVRGGEEGLVASGEALEGREGHVSGAPKLLLQKLVHEVRQVADAAIPARRAVGHVVRRRRLQVGAEFQVCRLSLLADSAVRLDVCHALIMREVRAHGKHKFVLNDEKVSRFWNLPFTRARRAHTVHSPPTHMSTPNRSRKPTNLTLDPNLKLAAIARVSLCRISARLTYAPQTDTKQP